MFDKYLEMSFNHKAIEAAFTLEYDSTIDIFNEVFDMEWSYKIDSLEVIEIKNKQNKVIILTVAVPGTIRSGIGNGFTTDQAIESALSSILRSLANKTMKTIAEKIVKDESDSSPVKIVSEIDPKILKVMNKYGMSKEQAIEFGKICSKYKIKNNSILDKYRDAWQAKAKEACPADAVFEINGTTFDSFKGFMNDEKFEIID